MARIACICPPVAGDVRHPDGDEVRFKDRLDFSSAAAMKRAVVVARAGREGLRSEEVLAFLTEAYLRYGIASWTLVDAKGETIPVNPDTVDEHLLSRLDIAMELGDEADERFSEVVLLPLLKGASTSSSDTPTNDSTSAPTGSPETPPTPSSPSSTTSTPTDAIGTTSTSPDGDSSSSPTWVSDDSSARPEA